MGDVSAVSDDPVVLYHVLLAEFLAQEWSAMLVQFSMAVWYSISFSSWRVPRPGVVGDAGAVLYGPVVFYGDVDVVIYGPVVFSTTLFLTSSSSRSGWRCWCSFRWPCGALYHVLLGEFLVQEWYSMLAQFSMTL